MFFLFSCTNKPDKSLNVSSEINNVKIKKKTDYQYLVTGEAQVIVIRYDFKFKRSIIEKSFLIKDKALNLKFLESKLIISDEVGRTLSQLKFVGPKRTFDVSSSQERIIKYNEIDNICELLGVNSSISIFVNNVRNE